MGNNNSNDSYFINIKLIGGNLENKFYNIINNESSIKNLCKLWKFRFQNNNFIDEINAYFDELKRVSQNENNINLREALICKIDSINNKNIDIILQKMNGLREKIYMPLVLFLTIEEPGNLLINSNKYKKLDNRFFFVKKYTEDIKEIEKEIIPILLRFCSIHNELGDEFYFKKKKFCLVKNTFPFNMNIACAGRIGQGKSTGVNELLGEYKAKETNKACSQTKKLIYYQVKDKPIRILDIPGFEDSNTVKNAVNNFNSSNNKIKYMTDNNHIILYFINFRDERLFTNIEIPMFEEIIQHKSSDLIYVITHSRAGLDEDDKLDFIIRLNKGIIEKTKNSSLYNDIEKIKATKNNIVFVNFHKDFDYNIEPFGKNELFNKIYHYFINSNSYKDSFKFSKENIDKEASKIRKEVEKSLKSDKIFGSLSGALPFIGDIIAQNFFIKKDILRKIQGKFGIEVGFIDTLNKKNKKKEMEEKKLMKGLEIEKLRKIDGNELTKDVKENEIAKTAKNISSSMGYWDIISDLFNPEAVSNMAEDLGEDYLEDFGKHGFEEGLGEYALEEGGEEIGEEIATSAAGALGKNLVKIVGPIIGVGMGYYSTNDYCNKLLDKFEVFFKNNGANVYNSYQYAKDYFNTNK